MRKNAVCSVAFLVGLLAVVSPALAQFDKYVALGDSITASFQGLCLVTRHQEASYPNLIAGSLGIGDFEQPLFAEGTLTPNPAINKCLGFVVIGASIGVGPVSDQLAPTNLSLQRPYDNLGIPGATAADLVNLTSANPTGNTANRFAFAILRNNIPGSPLNGTSAVQQAYFLMAEEAPNLVTLWIGNNDVLGALLSAVAIEGVTMTPEPIFEAAYAEILATLGPLVATTIVTLNIPDVSAIPFATTIPPVVLNPATGQPLIVNGSTVPLLGPGNTAYPCPGGAPACPLPSGTLVTLQAQALLQQGFGIPCAVAPLPQCNNPLPDGQFIPPSTLVPGVLLYPNEVAAISAKVDQLNGVIADQSAGASAITVDIHAIFNEIRDHGYEIGGITLTSTFGTGGIFSADGFHPNNVGQALVADYIVQALNESEDAGITRPNIAEALFTPDLPPGGSAAVTPDPEEAALWTRRQLFELFPPVAEGVYLLEPRTPIRRPDPRVREDSTRTLERPAADRRQ